MASLLSLLCCLALIVSTVTLMGVNPGWYVRRNRQQKALASIVETTRNVVIVTDAQGKITWVNKAFTNVTGYSPREAVGRKPGDLLQCAETSLESIAAMRQAIEQQRSFQGEIVNRAKSGRLYWLYLDIQPCFDDQGVLLGFTAIEQEVTDQKGMELQLKEANASLEKARALADAANISKTEFLTNMSHEIRTPMTAILGYADILTEIHANPGTHSALQSSMALETIKRNGQHLLSIINDILDIAKIEAGKITVEKIPVNTCGLIFDVMETMKCKAHAKALTLEARFDTPIPNSIETDPTRLRQILVNLIGNAIKFTEHGGVTVIFRQAAAYPNLLFMDVVDTGVGIELDQVDRLFGAFEQADNSTSRRFGGTGLGLSISKHLAELLGGEVTVDCQLKQGCRFTASVHIGNCLDFSTPEQFMDRLANYDQRDVPTTNRVTSIGKSTTRKYIGEDGPLNGVRILLAEDGPDNQRLITHILANSSAYVHVVDNGQLAVQAMTSNGDLSGALADNAKFDLILMDVQMPEMDGCTATELLRSKGCNLPIIALTAHAMSSELQRCMESGCNLALTKPINRTVLLEACAKLHQEHRRSMAPDRDAHGVLGASS